jgi:hypothetical protein
MTSVLQLVLGLARDPVWLVFQARTVAAGPGGQMNVP